MVPGPRGRKSSEKEELGEPASSLPSWCTRRRLALSMAATSYCHDADNLTGSVALELAVLLIKAAKLRERIGNG